MSCSRKPSCSWRLKSEFQIRERIRTYPGFSQTLSILRLCMLHLNNHKILKYLKIKKSMTPILEIPNSHTAINTYITMLSLNIKNARKGHFILLAARCWHSIFIYCILDTARLFFFNYTDTLSKYFRNTCEYCLARLPTAFLLLHVACQMTCAALYCKNY